MWHWSGTHKSLWLGSLGTSDFVVAGLDIGCHRLEEVEEEDGLEEVEEGEDEDELEEVEEDEALEDDRGHPVVIGPQQMLGRFGRLGSQLYRHHSHDNF